MEFQFYPLRFELIASEALEFPPGKAANILRGAMGVLFRQLACEPACQETRTCPLRRTCRYARVFEPGVSTSGTDEPDSRRRAPSGLADHPRPFVFRARHLDGCRLRAGDRFHFDLHDFSLDPDLLLYFVQCFAALAHEGLGTGRARAELQRVSRLSPGELAEQTIYEASRPEVDTRVLPMSLDLDLIPTPVQRIRVEFLSPTELKSGAEIAGEPLFPILFARIRDRLSTLSALYGRGPLELDFRGWGVRAEQVRMTRCEVRREAVRRRSTRTGQQHSIGGFVGFAQYEGDLSEFVPFLEAGRWVGVGRQAVWGKGEIAVHRQ